MVTPTGASSNFCFRLKLKTVGLTTQEENYKHLKTGFGKAASRTFHCRGDDQIFYECLEIIVVES